ncbi:MAG: SufD family Fe-S cluster assembly protein [Bacteroidales bacterium]|nr:SufD family Fe-S cluster assembly protein [Bacteroidales bacterium]
MRKVYVIGPGIEVPEHFTVGAGESLDICIIVLPGVSADIPLTVDLTGEGADARLSGIYLCGSDEHVSFNIRMNHLVPSCTSRQLFNGIASGSSRASFSGLIVVSPDAQKTEAYQENHNILLSDDARITTLPQLEIYADDVKCSHGATTGKLNEEEQFYMRSRGITASEAKILQMISFISPALDGLDDSIIASVEDAIRSLR